jgi:hypothetical protein
MTKLRVLVLSFPDFRDISLFVVHKKCSLLNGRIFLVPRSTNLDISAQQEHPSTFSLSLPLND